jgi:hypothetical protein
LTQVNFDGERDPVAGRRSDETDSSALTWRKWFTDALTAAGKEPADLVRQTEGTAVELRFSTISKWTSGTGGADPERVIIVAQLLDRDTVEALHAAGHHLIAEEMERRRGPRIQADRSAIDEGLAKLRMSDLPEHLKRKFENEYKSLVEPILRANAAAQRKFSDELDEALREQAQRAASDPGESDAESA